jgi:hypothetical protein
MSLSLVGGVQRKEAHGLKEEYHAFRDKGAVLLCFLATTLLIGLYRADIVAGRPNQYSLTPPFMVGVQLFLGWLLYFYTAMALRENVLKVGSRKPHKLWVGLCVALSVLLLLRLSTAAATVST